MSEKINFVRRFDMKEPLLSVIIPVFNVEKYLARCLESVVHYVGDEVEIILINDGSTDESPRLCQDFASRFRQIEVLNQDNKGLSAARNSGIRSARGEYIMFLDSDDFLKEESLKTILETIKDNRRDFYLGRAYQYYEDSGLMQLCQVDYNSVPYRTPPQVFISLHKNKAFWFAAWLIVINRRFLLENELFFKSGIYHEDELWVPSVFVAAHNMGFINEGFYCYRMNRTGSIVASPKIKREFDILTVADELSNLLGKSSESDLLVKDRQASIVFGVVMSLCQFSEHPDFADLLNSTYRHLGMLKMGKYYFPYAICKVCGLERSSRMIKKLSLIL